MALKRHDAVRSCLGCRRPQPREALIRIVRGPQGEAVFDPEGRLPGRGTYVCPSPSCVGTLSAGALTHVLRAPVVLPDVRSRRESLAGSLERRAANLVSIARKTRGVVLGPTGVRAALRGGRAALLLVAADLPETARRGWREQSGGVPVRSPVSADVLGRWTTRGPTEVAAICREGLAQTLAQVLDQWGAISLPSCDNDQPEHGRNPGPA